MISNEWPLVVFTFLSQLSAGLCSLTLLLVYILRLPPTLAEELRRHAFLAALLLALAALVISFLHLSRPAHAVLALSNIQHSWLSREIILLSLYIALLGVSYLTTRVELPGHLLRGPLYLLTALTGLLLIFSMVRLYMIPTVPPWNHAGTPVAFFNTALLAGSASLLAGLVFFSSRGMDWLLMHTMARMLAGIAMTGMIIHLVNAFVLMPSGVDPAAAFMPEGIPVAWKIMQLFFLFTAFASLAVWLVLSKSGPAPIMQALLYYAAIAVLLAELCARYQFYAGYYRVGV